MGLFAVDLELIAPGRRGSPIRVRDMIVDTGSEVSWVPAEILKTAGVKVRKKGQPFLMANGESIIRDIGYAILRCGDFETVDEVVFARPEDCRLLGARTLEGFNARVDPAKKRLVAAGPHLATGNRKG
ncbi:MAG: hypothetical protein HUU16_16100 [Candidatus Omnitrophica bacterium]|nr:hypothetical protein [bacterium]NUN97686.1 hypothetical protein [Candidatus Omnitrophota bacterium]